MDYEKKYKEALEVAKRKLCFDKAGMVDSFTPNDIYEMFPELKEDEDDRIRKELIGFLRNIPNSNYTCEEMALWLEKQGENHLDGEVDQPRYNIGDIICDKSCTTLNKDAQPNMEIVDIKNGMYICDKGSFHVSQQDEYELVSKKIDSKLNDDSVSNELREASFAHAKKEIKNPTCPDDEEFELAYTFEEGAKWDAAQKPTWSEEDEGILDEIIDFLENGTVKLQHDLSLYASWLKSLKGRVGCEANCTTTKEWSEEDEEILNLIIARLQSHADVDLEEYSKEYDWLNSPKARYTWKPSDEQMKALNYVVNLMASSGSIIENYYCNVFKDLREQLKKLK